LGYIKGEDAIMSEMTESTAASGSNTWDYRDEIKTEPTAPVKVESKVEEKEPNSEATSEEQTDPNKPWLGKKSETPGWAKKRFKEYSTTVSELKSANSQLMEQMREVLGQLKPDVKKLKEADFPDKEAYDDWREEQRVAKIKDELRKEQSEQNTQLEEQRKMQDADRQNVDRARADLTDYEEVISQGDPDIRLPHDVIRHLNISPAGPYVKYRLASDDELAEQIKSSSPQEKLRLITELHDSVLEQLIQRQKADTNVQPPAQNSAPDYTQPRTPSVQRKLPPPKAPPVVKGKGNEKSTASMTGDEYARHVNSLKRKK
jgi:hypothetical protein